MELIKTKLMARIEDNFPEDNLLEMIRVLDNTKQELDQLRPLGKSEQEKLNQKLKLDWNYHSNSIEGNTLSKNETRAFILHNITAKGKPFRDYIEMRGHNEALKTLQEIVSHETMITESLIKDLHQIILVEPYTDAKAEVNPGEYKTRENYLYMPNGERLDFVPVKDVAKELNKLINWLNNQIEKPKRKKKTYNLHPILISAAFQVRFIQIHPFGDGNGRLSRILGNLILMQCGYTPAIIRLEKREEYYNMLNLSSLENPEPLAEMIAYECYKTMKLTLKAAKGESIEDDGDLEKRLKLLEKLPIAADDENIKLNVKQLNNREFYNQNIQPLFTELEISFKKIEVFFADTNISFQFNGQVIHVTDFNYLKNCLQESFNAPRITLKSAKVIFYHKQFKKAGIHAFNIEWRLHINFEDTKYRLKTERSSQDLQLEKLYHQNLIQPEFKRFSENYLRNCLDKIDEELEHVNRNTK